MGGTKSATCNNICLEIWKWFAVNDAWITCSNFSGKANFMADAASRKLNDRHAWKLNEDILRELGEILIVPTIDLFASKLNEQEPCFCSWKPDPEPNTVMYLMVTV